MTPRHSRRTAAETREHVLEVAHDLFYWRGIRSTGVDLVADGPARRARALARTLIGENG